MQQEVDQRLATCIKPNLHLLTLTNTDQPKRTRTLELHSHHLDALSDFVGKRRIYLVERVWLDKGLPAYSHYKCNVRTKSRFFFFLNFAELYHDHYSFSLPLPKP